MENIKYRFRPRISPTAPTARAVDALPVCRDAFQNVKSLRQHVAAGALTSLHGCPPAILIHCIRSDNFSDQNYHSLESFKSVEKMGGGGGVVVVRLLRAENWPTLLVKHVVVGLLSDLF